MMTTNRPKLRIALPAKVSLQPGFGFGALHIGQTEKEVMNYLGPPDKVKVFEDSYFYRYTQQRIDLDFGRKGGHLEVIFFYKARPLQKILPSKVSASGVALGDTKSSVLERFGKPDKCDTAFRLSSGRFNPEWFYYSTGIQFSFDRNGHVSSISVNKVAQ